MAGVKRVFAILAVTAFATAAAAHDAKPPADSDEFVRWAYNQSRAAIGREVGDVTLRDEAGRPVALSSFRGKPLAISFVYTSCDHTCPLITQNLARAVSAAEPVLGPGSFAIATVGFDTRVDTPPVMRQYARTQRIDVPAWRFLAGDAPSIERLANDLGFVFTASARGFDHLAQVTLLDAEGRVYRQIYGSMFDPPAVIEPLKELILGGERSVFQLSGLFDRFKLFCTYYDPSRDAYQVDYGIVVSLLATFSSFLAAVIFVLREWRRRRAADRIA